MACSEDLLDHLFAVFDVLLFCPCFAQLFGHLVALVVKHLGFTGRLIQVCPDHLLAYIFVILSALNAHTLNLALLKIEHVLHFLVGLPGLISFLLTPSVRLNGPQLVGVVNSVKLFLCLLLDFALLHLLLPELALRLLSLLLDAQLVIDLLLMVFDLLLELIFLAY